MGPQISRSGEEDPQPQNRDFSPKKQPDRETGTGIQFSADCTNQIEDVCFEWKQSLLSKGSMNDSFVLKERLELNSERAQSSVLQNDDIYWIGYTTSLFKHTI